jgi:hypothetical protein
MVQPWLPRAASVRCIGKGFGYYEAEDEMSRHALIATLLVAFTTGAEAIASLNTSRSNIYKTAADCKKAGGTWTNGRDGLGCYMPVAKR